MAMKGKRAVGEAEGEPGGEQGDDERPGEPDCPLAWPRAAK
jgi:hypothetical protein